MRLYDVQYKTATYRFRADDAMDAFEQFTHLRPFGKKMVSEYNLLHLDKDTGGYKWALYAAMCYGQWTRIKVKISGMGING